MSTGVGTIDFRHFPSEILHDEVPSHVPASAQPLGRMRVRTFRVCAALHRRATSNGRPLTVVVILSKLSYIRVRKDWNGSRQIQGLRCLSWMVVGAVVGIEQNNFCRVLSHVPLMAYNLKMGAGHGSQQGQSRAYIRYSAVPPPIAFRPRVYRSGKYLLEASPAHHSPTQKSTETHPPVYTVLYLYLLTHSALYSLHLPLTISCSIRPPRPPSPTHPLTP